MKKFFNNKTPLQIILNILGVMALIVIAVMAFSLIGKFVIQNLKIIVCGILAVIALVIAGYLILDFFKNLKKAPQQNNTLAKEVANTANKQHEVDMETAENNYATVGRCLSVVVRDAAASLNLVAPNSITDLEAQIHASDNGNYVLLHYVCQKKGNVDIEVIREVLSNRIAQKLRADEFNHLSEPFYLYEGRSYPIIMIDNVIDVSAYVNIDVVIVNKNYCEHLRNRAAATNISANHNDNDF